MENISEDKKNENVNIIKNINNNKSKMTSINNAPTFFNGQSQNVPAIKNSFFQKEEPFFNGPIYPKHKPCLPIHFQPPREILNSIKTPSWFPTNGSMSTQCYKQTADCIDKQPPKPLPKYKKINIYKNKINIK